MTVSRVIHREAIVGAATRARVEGVIAELGYRPNRSARSLAGSPTSRIHLVFDAASRPHLNEILLACAERTASLGLELVVVPAERIRAPFPDGPPIPPPDAIVLAPSLGDDEDLVEALAAARVPTAAIGTSRTERDDLLYLRTDPIAAARAMTSHLLELGHRRIGLLLSRSPRHIATLHEQGYAAAFREAPAEMDRRLVRRGEPSYRAAMAMARSLLLCGEPPTAIIASSAAMAAAVVAAAQASGRDVPADLSICALDDAPIAEMVWPQITVVRHPIGELTRLAIELLLARMETGHSRARPQPASRFLSFELVRRQSDAAPRRRPSAR